MDWLASKKIIGFVVLLVAIANVYWAAKIYSLMNANGEAAFVEACKAKAHRLSQYSKLSYLAVAALAGICLYLSR